ncbi:ATP-binding cassette sub-family G member 4 [Cardiocondyla obscurior]|uniref:ATP-binding cassette sub-family G member 4 n=1 Tax=Cardiocondyla obscurior TaxID=286306 RepID=UPI0039658471
MRRVSGVSGEVRVNGKIRAPQSERWKRTSCYIQQDSILRTYITVGEAMTLAAHLKLGYTISSAYKHSQVLELLEMLGLSHCYDTLCGKLSGGQKKRLDIALELLTNPSVLFLDEPTTGLDSSSCSQCVALMKRLAELERRTVICTIHQPSALLLEMFDSLYVVAGGYCIYRGPVSSLLPHLASVGAHCPPYHNPADFVRRYTYAEGCRNDGRHSLRKRFERSLLFLRINFNLGLPSCLSLLGSKRRNETENGLNPRLHFVETAINYSLGNNDKSLIIKLISVLEVAIGEYGISLDKLVAAAETIPCDRQKTTEILTSLPDEGDVIKEPPPPAGFLTQCYLLYKRQLLSLKRDYSLIMARLLCHLLIGVIFGYLYMGSGYRANVLANYVYLYGSLLLLVYTGKMAVTLAFPLEMRILMREHFNRWYRLAPYYISILLIEIPFQAACAASYLVVSYWLTGQPIETNRIIFFMVVSIAASLTAQAWGFFIGVTTPIKIAVFIGPIIAVLFSIFGFCIRYFDTPHLFRWMFHISYFRAGFHSLLYTVYGFDRMDLLCDEFYCHYKKPSKFLNEMEINDVNVVNNLVLILGIGVLMHLLTASALWCKLNRR